MTLATSSRSIAAMPPPSSRAQRRSKPLEITLTESERAELQRLADTAPEAKAGPSRAIAALIGLAATLAEDVVAEAIRGAEAPSAEAEEEDAQEVGAPAAPLPFCAAATPVS